MLAKENFKSVSQCAIYLISNNKEMNNKQLAEEVSRVMGSNTSSDSIAWYKGQLKKGKINADVKPVEQTQSVSQQLNPTETVSETLKSFPTVAHCVMYFLNANPEWSNKKIAEEVSRTMNSNTGSSSITWYKGKLKKGEMKMERYLSISQTQSVPVVVLPKPIDVENDFVLPKELIVTEDDIIQAKGIQKLALQFFNERSERSFTPLYNRLKPGMTNHALKLLNGNESLANDVVANAFTKIWTKIDQYNKFWSFSTWAYRIVYNESMQIIRKEKLSTSLELGEGNDDYKGTNESVLVKHGADTELLTVEPEWGIDENTNLQNDVYEKVLAELHDLPTMYKEIMIDRELNDMKYKQIADKYGININSVKTRIKRARTQLIESNMDYYKIVQRRNRKRTVAGDSLSDWDASINRVITSI